MASCADGGQTITQLAISTSSLSTLVAALTAADAGVLTLLSDPTAALTVFAPDNAAFIAVGAEPLAALLADKTKLTNVLKKHVLPAEVLAAAALTLKDAVTPTVEPEAIVIDGQTGSVLITPTIIGGSSKVITADIQACNGVIHIVDKVLALDSMVDNPCFARDTTACLVHDATATPSAAYDSCFLEGAKDASLASRVPMPELKAGDLVLSTDAEHNPTLARVIVTQHAQSTAEAAMLTLTHTKGKLSLTPDHVLLIDGQFVAARDAKAGSMLSGDARITSVKQHAAGIINPITSNNRILAAGGSGLPVVSSTHPEWIASWMLSTNVYPLPYSIASTLSYLFPESVQSFYDAYLEPFFVGAAPALKAYKGALPAIIETPLVLGAFLFFDVALALAFAARAALSIEGVALIAIIVAATKKAKEAKGLKVKA